MGAVILDNITLDLDPETLIINEGERRGSEHKTVNGSTFFQDFGFDVTDLRITLRGKLTSQTVMQNLWALWRKTGHQFRYQDFRGNDLTVIFAPKSKFPISAPRGSTVAWEYEIRLAVIAASTYVGASFPSTS